MSTWCRHVHVRPHCFILTEACSCRLELAYFALKISKNRLVCKNAVALAYYGSCRLLVMCCFWLGHFRVPLCLRFKARLGAKPFLWMKLHAELIFKWKVSHLDSFWNRGTRELGNGLLETTSSQAHEAGSWYTKYILGVLFKMAACLFYIGFLHSGPLTCNQVTTQAFKFAEIGKILIFIKIRQQLISISFPKQ